MNKVYIVILLSTFLYTQSQNASLTIYKDGTALVKQPVNWSIKSGYNYRTWDKLPNGIDRDTPFLNVAGVDIISQRFNDNVFSGSDYFNGLRGQQVQIKPTDGKLVKGALLEVTNDFVTLSRQTGVISFNRNEVQSISTKSQKINPIFTPFISWELKSKGNSKISGELVYKSANFSWSTVYRLKMVNEEKGELIAEAVVSNKSDMGFQDARLQLVEGNLNKANFKNPRPEKISRALAASGGMLNMSKDQLGDYHIYSLNDKHNLDAKESITVRMYGPLEVGYNKKYVFENSERRQKEEPLEVQLTMENTESNGLGISLPGGKVEMYSYNISSGLEYIGADNMGQVPKGRSTTFSSGRAFDVIGNRKVLNYDRQRKSEEAVIEIKVTNARNEEVEILLVEHINGDWIIKDPSLNYQKKDASTIHFVFSVQAGETKSVYYTYRKEWK